MTKDPIAVTGNIPIFKIEKILRENKIWTIIIQDSGKCIGIVTKSDLKHRKDKFSPQTPAYAIMTRSMTTIDPENDVEFALSLLIEKNINSLPVVKNGILCGIITRFDIREKYFKNKNGDYGMNSMILDTQNELSGTDTRYSDDNNQNPSPTKKGFFNRFKEDVTVLFHEFFLFPLKRSYREDTIEFLALLAGDIGLVGLTILAILFTFWFFFFQRNYIPGSEPPPFEIFFIPFGIFAILLAIGMMILNAKRQRIPAKKINPIHEIKEVLNNSTIGTHKFEIALSFSGKHRNLVQEIAFELREDLGENTIFYDNFYKAYLAQPNLDLVLQKIYKDNSNLNVIFLSSDYDDKEWCGIEFRAIRELIKTGQSNKIMLLKLGEVNVEGLFSIDGYLDIRNMAPLEISSHIIDRTHGLS